MPPIVKAVATIARASSDVTSGSTRLAMAARHTITAMPERDQARSVRSPASPGLLVLPGRARIHFVDPNDATTAAIVAASAMPMVSTRVRFEAGSGSPRRITRSFASHRR